jgi:hypothetical protein
MKLTELETKLMSAARAHAPSDQVPYAFEKRVMAYIKSQSGYDVWAVWAQALWRSAGACLAVVVLLGAISIFMARNDSPVPHDLSQDFEKTMLAGLGNDYYR